MKVNVEDHTFDSLAEICETAGLNQRQQQRLFDNMLGPKDFEVYYLGQQEGVTFYRNTLDGDQAIELTDEVDEENEQPET